jgi:quercetin dioxygenase-like cupin family protein
LSDAPHAPREPFAVSADLRWEELGGGVRRQLLGHVADLMMVRVDFDAHAIGSVHHHPHRQASYVAAGRFRVTVGEQIRELGIGDCFITVADVPHGVVALEAGTLVDVFTPARADFLLARSP